MKQIAKFLAVGGTAFLIDYGVMLILTEMFGIHYMVSNILSFSLSVLYNYVLSVYWVFSSQRKEGHPFILFVLLSVTGAFLNSCIMWGLVEKIQIRYQWAKIGATGVVMIFNFITRKWLLEEKTDFSV